VAFNIQRWLEAQRVASARKEVIHMVIHGSRGAAALLSKVCQDKSEAVERESDHEKEEEEGLHVNFHTASPKNCKRIFGRHKRRQKKKPY
jgi:hypothetical protein